MARIFPTLRPVYRMQSLPNMVPGRVPDTSMPPNILTDLPFFSEAAISSVLDWSRLIEAIEEGLIAFSSGKVAQPVREMIPVPGKDAFMAAMPAVGDAMAVKIVTVYPGNVERGLSSHHAVIVLFDIDDGTPVAVLDGRLITEMRTAAATVAAARRLAAPAPDVVTIMGSGVQARAHAEALAAVLPCGVVRLWARNGQRGRIAADTVGASFVADAEHAVRDADIVVCATSAKDPIVRGDWLKSGAFVAAVGWNTRDGCELDDAAMAHTVVVDSRDAALDQSGNIRRSGCEIFAELGEILAETKRVPEDATVIYDSVGIAIMDVAAARLAYDLLR